MKGVKGCMYIDWAEQIVCCIFYGRYKRRDGDPNPSPAPVQDQDPPIPPCTDSRTLRPSSSTSSSLRHQLLPSHARSPKTHFRLLTICSVNTSTQYLALNSRMNLGSLSCQLSLCLHTQQRLLAHHNSLAIPKSLQHRIRALLLHASVAVGMPEGSKYSCSPRATETSLDDQLNLRTRDYHRTGQTT